MNLGTVRRIFDENEARGLLAPVLPPVADAPLELVSVWIKPGRHCNVCWRSGESMGSLCLVDEQAAARFSKAASKPEPGKHDMHRPARSRPFAMAGDGILAQAFPFDYRLPDLGDALLPDIARSALGDDAIDESQVAAYRPGMRCQIRYRARGLARAYAKVSASREAEPRRLVHRELARAAADTAMQVPPLLATTADGRLDFVAAVPGRSLHDCLHDGPDPAAVRATVGAFAALRSTVATPSGRFHSQDDELALLGSWVEWTAALLPEFGLRAKRVLDLLARSRPPAAPPGFVHRDFYDRQVLLDGSRSFLLDIDTACAGELGLDFGNFLAHLFLRGLQWDREASHRDLEAAAFDVMAEDLESIAWYRRTALLRLACLYRWRPAWRDICSDLLNEAERPKLR